MVEEKRKARRLEGGLDRLLGMGEYSEKKDRSKRDYNNHSEVVKNSALTYMLIENMSVKNVSVKLKINSSLLYTWKAEKEKELFAASKIYNEKLDDLYKENHLLNEEKIVLIKAQSIISKSLVF